jgi:hypothetical protein
VRRRLLAMAVVAALSVLPPFLADVHVSDAKEIVDHVIPGVVALLGALWALRETNAGRGGSTGAFAGVTIAALGGIWEVATHVPLVLQTGEVGRPVGTVALHATLGFVLSGLSLWTLWRLPSAPAAPARRTPRSG